MAAGFVANDAQMATQFFQQPDQLLSAVFFLNTLQMNRPVGRVENIASLFPTVAKQRRECLAQRFAHTLQRLVHSPWSLSHRFERTVHAFVDDGPAIDQRTVPVEQHRFWQSVRHLTTTND